MQPFVIDLKFRLGETCSHIGALLFLIAEQVVSGKNLPEDLSAKQLISYMLGKIQRVSVI
jgi:hypothetical protein